MLAQSTVTIQIPRWTQEEVNVIDLLVNRIVEIRKYNEKEVDVYVSISASGLNFRAGSIYDLTDDDFELWESNKREFWIKHISQVTSEIVSNISNIHDPNWGIK